MLPLLLLTTLLPPLTQGETCISRQDVLDIVKDMETKMAAEMETIKAEMESLKAELEVEMKAIKAEIRVSKSA